MKEELTRGYNYDHLLNIEHEGTEFRYLLRALHEYEDDIRDLRVKQKLSRLERK